MDAAWRPRSVLARDLPDDGGFHEVNVISMSALQFRTFHLTLPAELEAAFVDELREGEISEGIFCMRPSPIDEGSIFILWIRSNSQRHMATVPRSAFGNTVNARATARNLARIWM